MKSNSSAIVVEIETLRKELITTVQKEGLSSEKTIKLSQKLDVYLVEYQLKTM